MTNTGLNSTRFQSSKGGYGIVHLFKKKRRRERGGGKANKWGTQEYTRFVEGGPGPFLYRKKGTRGSRVKATKGSWCYRVRGRHIDNNPRVVHPFK